MTDIQLKNAGRPAHMRLRSTPQAEQLRAEVTQILASVPNVEDHLDGIELVIGDVIQERMTVEDHYWTDATRKHPSFFAVPAIERARITRLLRKAIEYSGMSGYQAWNEVYAPLIALKSRAA